MSIKRHATRRDDNEPEIVVALVSAGAKVIRMDQPVDLLVEYKGKLHLVEVKDKKNRKTYVLTPNQIVLMEAGWPISVVTSTIEALVAIGAASYV